MRVRAAVNRSCPRSGPSRWNGRRWRYVRQFDPSSTSRAAPIPSSVASSAIFSFHSFEADWGDDAVHLNTTTNVQFGPGNVVDVDTFGEYGVCDFDGDRVDDLFLATGATWWFSSYGEFHWSYLTQMKERRHQVRRGYFDGDLRCDVLAERDGRWTISSGGTGDWQMLGAFGAPWSEVQFGRFDPNRRDQRIGVHRPRRQHRRHPAARRQTLRIQSGNLPVDRTTLMWWRSKNGTDPWTQWKQHVFQYTPSADTVTPRHGFAGRFGAARGGGTLVIGPDRFGHFFSAAELAVGVAPDWDSLYAY